MADAGVVDQNIQPGPGRKHGLRDTPAIVLAGHVQRQKLRLALFRSDVFSDRASALFVAVGYKHKGARLCEGLRDGRADAGAGAGDQADFVVESEHG